jgi:hypothetical protein
VIVRGDGEPQVLLPRRNSTLRFMAGHHVFSGGRVNDNESVDCEAEAAEPDAPKFDELPAALSDLGYPSRSPSMKKAQAIAWAKWA